MDVFEAIRRRRSIRKYHRKNLDWNTIIRLLEAARLAPSAKNLQPWKFIVVSDQELKDKLVKACYNQKFIADASIAIVGIGDAELSPRRYQTDVTIALEHIVLEATELGLGTCWIGAFKEDEVKELLKIPDKYRVVALLTIGYPAESPPPRPRKKLKEIVYHNVYGVELR